MCSRTVSDDQGALFGASDAHRGVGDVEAATRRALAAAALPAEQEGTAAALLSLAWALDAARAAGKFYGVAQAAPPYTDLARALGLTVDTGKGPTDDRPDADSWLRQLTDAALGDPPQS